MPHDELDDRYYGFRWKLADDTESVLGGDDASDCIFEGGVKYLQLWRVAHISNARSTEGWGELAVSRLIRPSCELGLRSEQYKYYCSGKNLLNIDDFMRETKEELIGPVEG